MERRPSPSGADSVDERLREALAPEPQAVRRLTRRCLSEDTRREDAATEASRWQPAVDRAAWAFATVLVAAVALLLFLGPGATELHERSPASSADSETIAILNPVSTAGGAAAPRSRAAVTISNETGAVTVTSRSGTAWILLPGGKP